MNRVMKKPGVERDDVGDKKEENLQFIPKFHNVLIISGSGKMRK